MEHPFTLHEDGDTRVVQLSGEYSLSWGCNINELKAVFCQSGHIELHRFQSDDGGEVTRFSLSTEETAALFAAWETFKAEKELKKLLEEKRIASAIIEAHALLADLPIEIIHEPESDTEWRIHSDTINTIRYHAYHADQLLERAKLAVKDYERHLVEQAIHDEIKALKATCPVIRITGTQPWHVNIPEPDIYGEYARTPEQLLERVKAAQATYGRWQAEQDELIKTND